MPDMFRRVGIAVVVVATLVSACTNTQDDAYTIASDIVARSGSSVDIGDRPTTEFGDGCIAEIVRDEYGFPVEVQRCDENDGLEPGQPDPPSDFGSWLGSPDALSVASIVRELAVTGECENGALLTERLRSLADASALLAQSSDADLRVLGDHLHELGVELDSLGSSCSLGRTAWLEVVDETTNLLALINDQIESLRESS